MDAHNMTAAELRKLADEKEQEKPVKVGYLKHDLYQAKEHIRIDRFELLTTKKVTSYLDRIKDNFEVVLKKGTEFVCYMEPKESWYDNIGYGVESMSKEWAEENLENIKSS